MVSDLINPSINDIAIHLGYHPDQVKFVGSLTKDHDILGVMFEIFTTNIVCVLPGKSIKRLSKRKVNRYCKDYKVEEEFPSYVANNILESGIKNQSLNIDFLARILNIENSGDNGIYSVQQIGMNLYFNDGLLTDFQPLDGLNEWARSWKKYQKKLISDFEAEANLYWKEINRKIIQEINTQATAYANVAGTMKNPYVELHETAFGTINFVMLLVCHDNHPISLPQFVEINHGRYKKLSEKSADGLSLYQLGKFTYEFEANRNLKKFYMHE